MRLELHMRTRLPMYAPNSVVLVVFVVPVVVYLSLPNFVCGRKSNAGGKLGNEPPTSSSKKSFGKKPTFPTPAHENHSVYKGFRV